MSDCTDPRLGDMLHAWELGMIIEEDERELELHLLECEECNARASAFQDAALTLADHPRVQDAVQELVDEQPDAKRPRRRIKRTRIYLPVLAAAAALLLLVLSNWRPGFRSGQEAVASLTKLAVMPFENLGAVEDEYFADGITLEIMSRLTRLSGLGVMSRGSTMQYKGTDKTTPEIGRELGIDYLLDGAIRWDKSGGQSRLQIHAQLIRVSDDVVIWAERFDAVLDDVFKVQAALASKVAQGLDIVLLEREFNALAARPTGNMDAYNAYLRGLELMARYGYRRGDLRDAAESFQRAVGLDSSFAVAWAELSRVELTMYHLGYERTDEQLAAAKTAVDRAIELQPELAEAHIALGWYYYGGFRDYDRAWEEFTIAENQLPNDIRVLHGLGIIHKRQGQFEDALDYALRAFDLNPRDPTQAAEVAIVYARLGLYDETLEYWEKVSSLAPDLAMPYRDRAHVYRIRGDLKTARAILEQMPDSKSHHWYWERQERLDKNYEAALEHAAAISQELMITQNTFYTRAQKFGAIYWLKGDYQLAQVYYDSARVILEQELSKWTDDSRLHAALGVVYAGLGRKEDAIREGKKAVELMPVSEDVWNGPDKVLKLAEIYVMVGEYDLAIDQLETLLRVNAYGDNPLLQINPIWDPLRDHPRFKRLVEELPA